MNNKVLLCTAFSFICISHNNSIFAAHERDDFRPRPLDGDMVLSPSPNPYDMISSASPRPSEEEMQRRAAIHIADEKNRRLEEAKRIAAEDKRREEQEALIQKIRADFEKRIADNDEEPVSLESYASILEDDSLNELVAIPIGGGRYSFYTPTNLTNFWQGKSSNNLRDPLTNKNVDKVYVFRRNPNSHNSFPFEFVAEESADSLRRKYQKPAL